jgi:Aspartyl protease
MKNLTPLLLVLFLFCCDQKKPPTIENYQLLEKTLQSLLHDREYFRLQSELQKKESLLPAHTLKFYQAFVESAFNHGKNSILLTESLLTDSDTSLNDSARVDLMLLLRDNYFKSYQYRKAAETGQNILKHYKNILGDRLNDIENTLLIHEGLKDTPPQRVDLKKVTLKWNPNKLGLVEIPLRTKTSTLGIAFDTRAHISTVTRSFAKKLGLRILDVSFEESSGITGIKFKSGLGVADSLYLGDMLIQNAVFQVLPDEQLHFPSLDYTLDGILGFQVITQFKEIHIFQGGEFTILPTSTPSPLNNLAFDGSTTVVSVINDNDTLSFHLDTGATGTEFYANYFNRFKTRTINNGTLETVESGGVGGSIKTQVYILPNTNFEIGGKKIELKDIAVRTQSAFKGQRYNGNIGQDIIKQFDEMILNFELMYLDFK